MSRLWPRVVVEVGQADHKGLLTVRQRLQLLQHDAELGRLSHYGLTASVVSDQKSRVVLAFRWGHLVERRDDRSSCEECDGSSAV